MLFVNAQDSNRNERAFRAGVREFALLAVGFGCMVAYCRMFASGFSDFLVQGGGTRDVWYGLRAGVSLASLAVLAASGWFRWFKVSAPALLLATVGSACAAILFAIDTSGAFGWLVALVGGVSTSILMFVWMLLLSRHATNVIATVTVVGLVVSAGIIGGASQLNGTLSLAITVASALLAGVTALVLDPGLHSCEPDGAIGSEEATRIPWLTCLMILACGFLCTVLYSIAAHLTWLYDWSPEYIAFGVAVLAVLVSTIALMLRSPRWTRFAWIPQFVLFVFSLTFACVSVRVSIQIAVGLMLASVFCAHFLHWAVFPALFSELRIPRSFMAGAVLFFANGSLATMLGDAFGSLLPHSMQNLGGVAGIMVIMLAVVFVATAALYRRLFGTLGLLAVLDPGSFDPDMAAPIVVASEAAASSIKQARDANPVETGASEARVAEGPATSSEKGPAGRLVGNPAKEPVGNPADEPAGRPAETPAASPSGADGDETPAPSPSAAEDREASSPNPLDALRSLIDGLAAEHGLTPREREVGFLTVQGFSCAYIAEKLVVSESTVRFHQKNLYRKLDVHSRNELIEFVANQDL